MAEGDPPVGPASAPDAPTTAPPPVSVGGFPTAAGPVDLLLRVGDILHVTGPNGSGKTSLLRALAGLPSAVSPARCEVVGRAPADLPAPSLARLVHFAPQDPRDGLVGLTVAGEFRLRGSTPPADLAPILDRDVATLSSGETRRVALAVASSATARLLLLDEPAEGLDAAGRRQLAGLVRLHALHGAVVVTDHAGWAADVANRVLELAPPQLGRPLAALPVLVGPTIVEAPRRTVRRGRLTLSLPSVRLGPGLHVVAGPNGAGKSTLLERLAGLRDARDVTIHGQAPRPGTNVRLLQPDAGRRLTAATVRDELAGARDPWGFCSTLPRDRHPLALSAGEAHRLALAKVLGRARHAERTDPARHEDHANQADSSRQPPPLVLLDEPEAHLDGDGRNRLLRALSDLVTAGTCVVAATHDAGLQALAQTRIEVRA